MAADPVIYCLQELTDYQQFERLCSDVMAGVGSRELSPSPTREEMRFTVSLEIRRMRRSSAIPCVKTHRANRGL